MEQKPERTSRREELYFTFSGRTLRVEICRKSRGWSHQRRMRNIPIGPRMILDALTDVPEVWSKTALFLTYDENGGFFDHVVPPTVPPSPAPGLSMIETTNQNFSSRSKYAPGPYGLSVRVPMIVASPLSQGGRGDFEVFD